MSEHSVVRQRLAALDAAIEAMRGWGTGDSAGPIGVWSDRLAVDATEHGESGEDERCWVTAAGLYGMLCGLRGDMEEYARLVEEQAAKYGPMEWESGHHP